MEAGKLRHKVALQRAVTPTASSSGQRQPTYQTYGMAWAGFQPQSTHGEDASLGGKRAAQTRVLILMRTRTDMAPSDRIVWDDGRVFDVIGTLNTFEAVDEMVVAAVQVIT